MNETTSGPSVPTYRTLGERPGPRDRPQSGWDKGIPRQTRLADITCSRGEETRLIAVVEGADSEHFAVTVDGRAGSGPAEGGWLLACRCGWDHVVDEGLLRAALAGSAKKSGRATRLDVRGLQLTG